MYIAVEPTAIEPEISVLSTPENLMLFLDHENTPAVRGKTASHRPFSVVHIEKPAAVIEMSENCGMRAIPCDSRADAYAIVKRQFDNAYRSNSKATMKPGLGRYERRQLEAILMDCDFNDHGCVYHELRDGEFCRVELRIVTDESGTNTKPRFHDIRDMRREHFHDLDPDYDLYFGECGGE